MDWISKVKEYFLVKGLDYLWNGAKSAVPVLLPLALEKMEFIQIKFTFLDYYWMFVLPVTIFLLLLKMDWLKDELKHEQQKAIQGEAVIREMVDKQLDVRINGILRQDAHLLDLHESGKTFYASDVSLNERIFMLERDLEKLEKLIKDK